MFEKHNSITTFVAVSVTAALLAGVLVVSCAPVPESYPKGENAQHSSLSSNNSQNSAQVAAEQAELDGQWVCDSNAGCSYSSITISSKDGVAILNGSSQESAKLIVGTNSETNVIQLNMNLIGISGDAAKVSGSVSPNSKSGLNELVIGADTYSRQPVQAASANSKN